MSLDMNKHSNQFDVRPGDRVLCLDDSGSSGSLKRYDVYTVEQVIFKSPTNSNECIRYYLLPQVSDIIQWRANRFVKSATSVAAPTVASSSTIQNKFESVISMWEYNKAPEELQVRVVDRPKLIFLLPLGVDIPDHLQVLLGDSFHCLAVRHDGELELLFQDDHGGWISSVYLGTRIPVKYAGYHLLIVK